MSQAALQIQRTECQQGLTKHRLVVATGLVIVHAAEHLIAQVFAPQDKLVIADQCHALHIGCAGTSIEITAGKTIGEILTFILRLTDQCLELPVVVHPDIALQPRHLQQVLHLPLLLRCGTFEFRVTLTAEPEQAHTGSFSELVVEAKDARLVMETTIMAPILIQEFKECLVV